MNALWVTAAGYTILAIYFLFGMEWLFHVTKPSFFSILTRWQSGLVLFVSPVPYAIVAFAWLGLSALAARSHVSRRTAVALYALPPALFLWAALILMIDNFTYTMLKFGVATVVGPLRLVYGAFFAGLFLLVFRKIARRLSTEGRGARWALPSVGGLALVALLFALTTRPSIHQRNEGGLPLSGRPPDIFLISGDAFEVSHFERYGNPVESGSFFGVLGANAVAFENNFPNANRTAASTALVLTGKHATTTNKLNVTRYFTGLDAYHHLPGVLRSMGYRSIQIGGRDHVDSSHWGMRNAFDAHKYTTAARTTLVRISDALGGRIDWELHFSQIVADRVWERIRHAFGGELIERSNLPSEMFLRNVDTEDMVNRLSIFLDEHPGPVFAELHSMSTRYERRGSTDPLGTELDRDVSRIVEYLKSQGRYENSIIVIWSDHGKSYRIHSRLPLIIRFPKKPDIPVENLVWNTQTLDIAPTILDYLNAPIPEWMEGRSLLRSVDRYEPIFATSSKGLTPGIARGPDAEIVKGGLAELSMIVCDVWFNAHLESGKIERGNVAGHTTPCDPEQLPSDGEAECMLAQHLVERGYRRVIGSACR